MKRLALIATLALLCGTANACQRLEFAELNAMSDDELVAMRCQYRKDWMDAARDWGSGGPKAPMGLCSDMMERADRLIARRYDMGIDPKEYRPKVRQLCGES